MAPLWGVEIKATAEIQIISNQVKAEVEKQLQKSFSDFIAVRFIYQVPENIDYIIKIQGGATEWIHVKVFQDLPCFGGKVQFVGCQYPKFAADPVTPF